MLEKILYNAISASKLIDFTLHLLRIGLGLLLAFYHSDILAFLEGHLMWKA